MGQNPFEVSGVTPAESEEQRIMREKGVQARGGGPAAEAQRREALRRMAQQKGRVAEGGVDAGKVV